jgi:heme exporter protein C
LQKHRKVRAHCVPPAAIIRTIMSLIDLANPTRFLALAERVLPWLAAVTAGLLALGLYLSAMAPDDYQQGATVKIMFIHVPNAWLSMFVWGTMSVAALGTLVWRHPLADVAAKAAAPLGAAFTFLALVTGSLWGRPMWGTYWEWDARLTSVLILFLMYLGIMALWRAVEDPRARRALRSSRWSARSTSRSSNSRSTGGTRCIRARR